MDERYKKDEIEMAMRREKMLEVGFRVFSEHSIEDVPQMLMTRFTA